MIDCLRWAGLAVAPPTSTPVLPVPRWEAGLTVGVSRMSINVLVESSVDGVAVVILLQLLLSGGLGGGGVCGETGSTWTGVPSSCQQVGLQPWDQTPVGPQVTQSRASAGLKVSSDVRSEDGDTGRPASVRPF